MSGGPNDLFPLPTGLNGRGRGVATPKSCPQWEYSGAGSLAFANSRGFIRAVLSNIVDASIQGRAEGSTERSPEAIGQSGSAARREVPPPIHVG